MTGRSPLQDRVNKIYAQLMEDLGLFNAEAAEENLERLHYLREDEVATPDCGVGRETSKDLEDFRSDDLRAVARACLARAAAVVSEAPVAPATPPMDAVGRGED